MNDPYAMQVSLRVGECGLDLAVWLRDQPVDIFLDTSLHTDLGDMVEALLNLAAGAAQARFTFSQCDDFTIWTMQRADILDLLDVRIQYWAKRSPYEAPVPFDRVHTEFQVDREFFIATFSAELQKMATQYGFPGFCDVYGLVSEDFPWAKWRRLQGDHRS